MSTPSLTIRTATSHGSVPAPKRAMRADAVGSSLVTTTGSTPKRQRIMSAMPLAWSWSMAMTSPPASGSTARIEREPLVGAAQHRRQPLAVERQGGAQALRRAGGVEGVVEAGRHLLAVGRDPLHLAADPREVHRAHDPSVAQGVAVAVRVVGPGLVEHVADERDRCGVRPERACRRGPGDGGRHRRRSGSSRPRPARRRRGGSRRGRRGRRPPGRAAPGAADATCWYVVTTPWRSPASAVGGRPRRVEVEPDAVGGGRPLDLEVGGRGHHDQARRAAGRARGGPPPGRTSSCRRRGWRRPGSRASSASTNASKAAFCHGRRRIVLVIGGCWKVRGPESGFASLARITRRRTPV